MKGFPPHPGDAAALEDPPTFLALHEFDRTDLDFAALRATGETEYVKLVWIAWRGIGDGMMLMLILNRWAKRVMPSATKTEVPAFVFEEYFGSGLLFDSEIKERFSG